MVKLEQKHAFWNEHISNKIFWFSYIFGNVLVAHEKGLLVGGSGGGALTRYEVITNLDYETLQLVIF